MVGASASWGERRPELPSDVPVIGIWVKFLQIGYRWLYSVTLVFCCIGSVRQQQHDDRGAGNGTVRRVRLLLLKLPCEPAPLLLCFVLGPKLGETFTGR